MNADNINTLISKSLLGSLSDDEKKLLQSMIAQDPALRERYEELLDRTDFAEIMSRYDSIDTEKAKQRFFAQHPNHWRWTRVRLVAANIAAIALLVIGLWWWQGREGTSEVSVPQDIAQAIDKAESAGVNEATFAIGGKHAIVVGNAQSLSQAISAIEQKNDLGEEDADMIGTIVTRHDKEFWVTLDDGTRVHLNYGTTLSYPIHFNGDVREVEVKGEAYFCVSHDSRPFVVKTAQGLIHDYGTEFCVSTRNDNNTTCVVLLSGKVGVRRTQHGRESILRPGEQAVMSKDKNIVIAPVDTTSYRAWNTGKYVFDDCSLSTLADVVGRWYGRTVVFESDDIKNITISGCLDRYVSCETTLKALRKITGLKIVDANNKIIISK